VIKIYITHKSRHYNSKACRNKQQNLDIILELKEYKCKYCEIIFNRVDKQNEHEITCSSKDIYNKLTNIIGQKEKELELKDAIIKQKDDVIIYFKSQLQIYRPNVNYNDNSNSHNTNIIINNNININFNDIKDHLDKFNIHVLSFFLSKRFELLEKKVGRKSNIN
jgi:hypothetical protein